MKPHAATAPACSAERRSCKNRSRRQDQTCETARNEETQFIGVEIEVTWMCMIFAPQRGNKIPAWGIAPGNGCIDERALKGRQDLYWQMIFSPLQGSKDILPTYLGRCPRLVSACAVGALQPFALKRK
jgi:hypothetical protein